MDRRVNHDPWSFEIQLQEGSSTFDEVSGYE